MAFDFKKEYRAFYLPPAEPELVTVPPAVYLAVSGKGDPNSPEGEYQRALSTLYALAFTLKMSPRAGHSIPGFFDYVVPPLEGFWHQQGLDGMDYTRKDLFLWTSVIRVPAFIDQEALDWAAGEARRKGKGNMDGAFLLRLDEGLCVQCLHAGAYDDEPATVERMAAFCAREGLRPDFSDARRHHEIYLSDARRVPPQRRRTVIRHPVARISPDA